MNSTHLSGGTLGALIGFLSARYGWNVSDSEAYAFGATIGAGGALLAHLVAGPGLIPAVKRALFGKPPE